MTFWQDAAPATPRLRMPRRPPPRSSRWWSRRRRRGALVIVAMLVAVVGLTVVRAGGDATVEPLDHPAPRPERRDDPRVIPARWARTLPDWPALTVAASPGEAIVVGDHHVYSVELDDGALRWETSLPDVDRSAAVAGDTVLVSRDSGFAALERATGKVRWRRDTTETPSSVALVGPPGPAQVAVISTREGGLVGLDSHTGTVRWSTRLSQKPMGVFAVDAESGTLATVWEGEVVGSMLRVIDGATGGVRWEQRVGPMAGSPVISRGIVAIGAGSSPTESDVSAYALSDGSPRWKTHVNAPFQPDLVPLVDGDLFVVDQLGGVARLALDDGDRRWATNTEALSLSTRPIPVEDAILISNENGEVVTLDRDSGQVRARRRPAGLPVGLVAARRFVIVVQRLVRRDALQAFDAARLAAPPRRRG